MDILGTRATGPSSPPKGRPGQRRTPQYTYSNTLVKLFNCKGAWKPTDLVLEFKIHRHRETVEPQITTFSVFPGTDSQHRLGRALLGQGHSGPWGRTEDTAGSVPDLPSPWDTSPVLMSKTLALPSSPGSDPSTLAMPILAPQ